MEAPETLLPASLAKTGSGTGKWGNATTLPIERSPP